MKLRITTRKRTRNDGKTNVVFALSHKHKIRYLGTNVYILPEQFDQEKEKVIDNHEARAYNIELGELYIEYEKKLDKIERRSRSMSINDIVIYLKGDIIEGEETEFFYRSNKYIKEVREEGRVNYANSLQQTVDDIRSFHRSTVLDFEDIDKDWLKKYRRYREVKGSSVNTIAVHLRNIRTIFNDAINSNVISMASYPFRGFQIQTKRNNNRDLRLDDLSAIIEVEGLSYIENRYRDLWLLSFCLIGINYKDLLLAKSDSIVRGRLEYVRSKTERRKKVIETISVKILPQARKILDKYPGKKNLLCFVEERAPVQSKKEDKIERPIYRDVVNHSNRALKRIGIKAGLDIPLSTYAARHSWASIAFNECGISEDIIGFALGHASSRAITAGYIHKKLDLVDDANEKVLAKVFGQTNGQKKSKK